MNKKLVFYILTLSLVGFALLTLTRDPTASKVCYLGYKAHCSFTPFGTIILFVAAGITFWIANKTAKVRTK